MQGKTFKASFVILILFDSLNKANMMILFVFIYYLFIEHVCPYLMRIMLLVPNIITLNNKYKL